MSECISIGFGTCESNLRTKVRCVCVCDHCREDIIRNRLLY